MPNPEVVLEARKVFIDTEVFDRHQLNLLHPSLNSLSDLGKQDLIELLITDIIDQEVKNHIEKVTDESLERIKSAKGRLGILNNSDSEDAKSILADIDKVKIKEAAINNWEKWKKESNIQTITTNTVLPSDIFKKYFSNSPPFSNGKKKNEFPDAFSLNAVMTHAVENSTKVYVLSADSDLKNVCQENENLLHAESLESFLDLYYRAEEKLSEYVDSLIRKKEEVFFQPIAESFADFYHQHEDYEDAEIEILDVHHVGICEINIIKVDESEAIVELSVDIEGHARLSGPDMNSAIWDNESKQAIVINYLDIEMPVSGRFKFDSTILFDIEDQNFIDISSVDGDVFMFPSDDPYPYK